jgi:hypothetical protein
MSARIDRSVYGLRYVLANKFSIPGTGVGLSSTASRPAVGSSQPPVLWVSGIKRPGRKADPSYLFITEAKNMWSCAFTPSYVCFHEVMRN